MSNLTAVIKSVDVNSADRDVIAWYEVEGELWGFCVHEPTMEVSLLDCDGCPVNLGDQQNIEIMDAIRFASEGSDEIERLVPF